MRNVDIVEKLQINFNATRSIGLTLLRFMIVSQNCFIFLDYFEVFILTKAVKVSRGSFDMQIDLLICNNLFLSRGIYQVNGNDLDKVAL